MMRSIGAAIMTGVVLAGLSGCASTRVDDARAAAEPLEPRGVTIHDGVTGSVVPWEAMLAALGGADVVIIGEMHGHGLGLASSAAVWEDLSARGDLTPALSMEFFDRSRQAAIDDYLLGVLDEAGFEDEADRTARNYPPGHRSMVEGAKGAGLRVYAANAPRRYSTLAREEGYRELTGLRASQQALFELPSEEGKDAYRERFEAMFAGMLTSHGGEAQSPEALEARVAGYYRAQSVWDATMAGTVARAAQDGGRPVVHVVGRFHSDYDGGLVHEIARRRPGARVVTISMVESFDTEEDVGGEEGPRADFVIAVKAGAEHGG